MRSRWRLGVVDRISTWWQRAPQSHADLDLDWRPVEAHAEQLAAWLWHHWGDHARAYPDILRDYSQMCHDLGWHEHPWRSGTATGPTHC
jgi:hypothetical protein